jgi:hypothetical protein
VRRRVDLRFLELGALQQTREPPPPREIALRLDAAPKDGVARLCTIFLLSSRSAPNFRAAVPNNRAGVREADLATCLDVTIFRR